MEIVQNTQRPENSLEVQLAFAQTCILALQDKYGEDRTLQMIDKVLGTMDPKQALMIGALTSAMRSVALRQAVHVIH